MTDKSFSYRASRERLDEILRFFESQDFDLEKGREFFKEGIDLIKKSLKRVEEIENEIVEIKTSSNENFVSSPRSEIKTSSNENFVSSPRSEVKKKNE